ncbi:MAG: hypothetical protein WC736_16015 [Gallionella sp.]|jgi:hypothetical protein
MKINKKVVMAGTAAAVLATFSMPSHALRETEAGEANLVPFVIWDSNPGAANHPGFGPIGINTVVKLTVPSAVGNDVIPNYYTAPWTSPTNGSNLIPGPQTPPAFAGTKTIHWFFLNKDSKHVANGILTVTPDDVVVFDWGAKARQQGIQNVVDGVPGYLVFTTEAASTGLSAADFSFFAEAWMISGLKLGLVPPPGQTGGVIGLVDAKIPVIPMSDGADTIPDSPSVDNQVIERNTAGSVVASPLVGGMRTNWSDNNPTDVKVVDVTLGNRSVPIGVTTNIFQFPTLVVAWNDRNDDPQNPKWNNTLVDVFNDDEEFCSDSVDLSHQLNLIWVETSVTKNFGFPVPGFITNYGIDKEFCVPPVGGPNPVGITDLERILSGGFMKFQLPEQVDTGLNAPESSAVFFSIPLQYHVTLETDPILGVPVPTDISLIPFSTALGHDRGMFTQ